MSEEIEVRSEILKYLKASPYAPFIIVMASGDKYEVGDPNSAAVGKHTIIVVPPLGIGHSVLRLNQISSLNILEPA